MMELVSSYNSRLDYCLMVWKDVSKQQIRLLQLQAQTACQTKANVSK